MEGVLPYSQTLGPPTKIMGNGGKIIGQSLTYSRLKLSGLIGCAFPTREIICEGVDSLNESNENRRLASFRERRDYLYHRATLDRHTQ